MNIILPPAVCKAEKRSCSADAGQDLLFTGYFCCFAFDIKIEIKINVHIDNMAYAFLNLS